MFSESAMGRNPNGTIRTDLEKRGRAGWVLVGGASRRMGSDKALVEVSGEPLAMLAAAKVAQVCGSVSLVGDPSRYAGLGLPVFADKYPGAGPLAGVETALRNTEDDWNLVVACDMPALDPAILESLFGPGTDCALPRYADGPFSGRVEPLCAVYHRRCHAAIVEAIESGIRSVTDALATIAARHAITYVPVSSAASFANLNTPEDLRRYRNG